MDKKVKWLKRCGWLVYLVWHLIFVIVAATLLLPYITLPIINSVRIDAAPWHYAVYVSLMVALPFLSLVIVWCRFRHDVVAALKLFYAVELPLLLLLLLRVVLFREAPFAAQLVFCHIGIGIAGYFCMLWHTSYPSTLLGKYFDVTLSTIVALVGLYLGLLLGIYFLPICCSLLGQLWQGMWGLRWMDILDTLEHLITNPLFILYIVLFVLTAAFFLITPLLLIFTYLQQFLLRCRITPYPRLLSVVLGVVLIETAIFTLSFEQPQLHAFELSETLPTKTVAQAQILTKAATIREGLLNAYLAPYRYISTTGSSRSLKRSYTKVFGEQTIIADFAQRIFNGLAFPFLYQGEDFEGDKNLAAERYQQFFDTPIDKGEREKILNAVKATWENEQNEAGLMNAASRYVLLTEQSIKVEEYGNMARVTITQVLENQTYQPQEVVFHFELPEDSVMSGLWMSDDIENPEKFQHVVSPRGAAQAVYKAEVARRIDPALLEKVGPVQYRLRAFPIPARIVEHHNKRNRYSDAFRDFNVNPASVQFQYLVSIDDQGNWPLPVLLEKRNVYWNKQTKRSHKTESAHDWLPAGLTTTQPGGVPVLLSHTAMIDDNSILAIPRDTRMPTTAFSGPIAVIVDGSYSMNQVQTRLKEQMRWLQEAGVNYELFFCQKSCEKIDINTLSTKVYFGNSQLLQQLSQWNKDRQVHYSSLFVLTDAGSYELSPDKEVAVNTTEQPIWLVHLSEKFPYAYDDAVIDAVNDSGGGVAQTLAEAAEKFLWSQQINQTINDRKFIGISSDYFWYWLDTTSTAQNTDAFSAMAAGQWIRYLAAKSDKTNLTTLDQIHSVAKQFDVVSFYSSMLVLVEDRQRQLLKDAETLNDRFDREVETGEETLGKPMDPFAVPGVPEPEEWALLLITAFLVLIAYIRKRYPAQIAGRA